MAPKIKQSKPHKATRSSSVEECEGAWVSKSSAGTFVHRSSAKKPAGSYVVSALKGEEALEAAKAAGIYTPTGRLAKAYL